MTVEIRRLLPEDDRNPFRSGDESLDLFFHRYAGQNQFRHHIGVTYVAVESGRIVVFATVSAATVDPNVARKRGVPYEVPVLRLARLAVDEAARGAGIGKALLRHVLRLAVAMETDLGRAGVLVDAKPEAVEFHRKLGFAKIEVVEGALDSHPRSTPMLLNISAIPRPQ